MTIKQGERASDTLAVSDKAIRSESATITALFRQCRITVLFVLNGKQLAARLMLEKDEDSIIVNSLPKSSARPLQDFLQLARPLLRLDGGQVIHQYEQAVAGHLRGILSDLEEFLSAAIVEVLVRDYPESFLRIDAPKDPEKDPIGLEFSITNDLGSMGSFLFEISPEKAALFFGGGTA